MLPLLRVCRFDISAQVAPGGVREGGFKKRDKRGAILSHLKTKDFFKA